MNFPEGFDPLSVTKLTLNACYFSDDEEMDEAFRRAGEIFPNATFVHMIFSEMPDWCVVEIVPRVDRTLSEGDYQRLVKGLERVFSTRPFPDVTAEDEGWKPANPDGWKQE